MSVVKACVTAIAFFAVAQATIVINNVNVVGNGTSTVTWSSTDPENDPESFTIELTNPSFNTQFAVGNNVPTASGTNSFQTPQISPGPDYSIQFVNNSNANQILAQSPTFSVAENDVAKNASSSQSSKPTSSGLSSVGTSGLPASSSNPSVPSVTSPGASSPTFTQPGASNSSSSSAPPSSTSNTVFNNNGAGSLKHAPIALLLVGVAFAFF